MGLTKTDPVDQLTAEVHHHKHIYCGVQTIPRTQQRDGAQLQVGAVRDGQRGPDLFFPLLLPILEVCGSSSQKLEGK